MQIVAAVMLILTFYSIMLAKEPRKEARRTKEEHKHVYRIVYYGLIPLGAILLFILACFIRVEIVVALTLMIFISHMVFLKYAYRKKA